MQPDWKAQKNMYDKYYGFSGRPFQLTPDHRFFFDSRVHRKAMAYLTYGLSQCEGFIVITGDVGAGKTTLVNHLLSKMDEEHFAAGKIVTTQLGSTGLVRMVAAAFGIDVAGDKATTLQRVEAFLVLSCRRNIRPLLVVDEAQNLDRSALEELRMLSNFQLQEMSLLQIYLVGQPEFRQTLARSDLEQLRQRVIAAYHLKPMDRADTRRYIEHRLRHVNWKGDPHITEEAYTAIYRASSGGLPRKINLLADRLLTFCYLENKHEIDNAEVVEVVDDMRLEGLHSVNGLGSPETGNPDPVAGAPTQLAAPEILAATHRRTTNGPVSVPRGGTDSESDAVPPESQIGEITQRLDKLEKRLEMQQSRLQQILDR